MPPRYNAVLWKGGEESWFVQRNIFSFPGLLYDASCSAALPLLTLYYPFSYTPVLLPQKPHVDEHTRDGKTIALRPPTEVLHYL